MLGLDQWIGTFAHGASPLVVLSVAVLLGLRHASDPDHLVAVSTLVATEKDRPLRRAGRLGLAWGLGHATSLIVLGLPFVLVAALLPPSIEGSAEVLIGIVIMVLAVRLFVRWRTGAFHAHAHRHGPLVHRHLHPHASRDGHVHEHGVRSSRTAYAIGVLHGVGGSAGIALLLLGGIHDRLEATAALLVFASATAVSMAVLSSAVGIALGLDRVQRPLTAALPVVAAAAFVFGLFYAAVAASAL